MNNSFEAGMRNLNLGNDTSSYNQQHYNQSPDQSGGSQWNQGQYIPQGSDDEDDDQPLSYQQQPLPDTRNMATGFNLVKPSNFIKPEALQPDSSIVPQDMRVIQSLYENYSQKVYFEGYVYKKNDLTVDGKCDLGWSHWYIQLCGPVLTLWDNQADQSENLMPQYINITDYNVELVGRSAEPGRENVFSLNSVGANPYLFDVPDFRTLINWVCAISLSCFEFSRLQKIFTRSFLSRSAYSDVLAKPMNKMEGLVDVKFSTTNEWKKYWVVVSDRKEEKKLFGKKSVQSRGQLMFYESKKAKNPVFTMVNVVQSYILYPESPQAIDLVTKFKVEGSPLTAKSNGEQQPCSSALIMTSTSKELVQWTIGTFDAFKLYGRPTGLNDDPLDINSLNFGEPGCDIPRLFLEVHELSDINFTKENMLDKNAEFANILLRKIQYHRLSQQPIDFTDQMPPGATMYQKNTSRLDSQGVSTYSSQPSSISSPVPQPVQQQQQQQQQKLRNIPPSGRRVYASDEGSDDEEDEEDDEEEDSDRDSVFNNRNPKLPTLSLPLMTASEDDGFASSILGNIEKKSSSSVPPQASIQNDTASSPPQISTETLPTGHSSSTSLPTKEKGVKSEDDLSDSEDEEPTRAPIVTAKRPAPKMVRTQVSLSGSDTEEEEEEDGNAGYSGSDNDDDVPIHQQYQQQQQQRFQQQQYMDFNDPRMQYQQGQSQWDSASMYGSANMMEHQQQYFDEDGYPIIDEDGPVIPQLGDRFATQNSLLDTYRPDRASAHDQEGYARATGQPLIQVPNKPPEPRAGLVGMISQIESEKKQKESTKTRFGEVDRDRPIDRERERERYMMEQRSQMMQSMISQPIAYPGMIPATMQMMGGQMPMMNMMGQPMMYPGMMQMQNPNMMMMPQMMDPRMSMMMMQQQYGQYPMWQQQQQQQQQQMYGNGRFNGIQEDDDEDDNVPLGAKEPPIPRTNNNNNNQI